MKKTKIVCTIGPVTESVETLKELLNRGMNVMRLNFSHGDYEEHGTRIKNFRQAMSETGIRGGLLLDTKGPEIRTMLLKDGKDVSIKAGQKFTFTTDQSVVGDNERVAVTYENFAKDLKVGDIVLVDDGLLELDVTEIKGNEVICIARNSGDLGQKKGINLPNVSVNLPALSEKDVEDFPSPETAEYWKRMYETTVVMYEAQFEDLQRRFNALNKSVEEIQDLFSERRKAV